VRAAEAARPNIIKRDKKLIMNQIGCIFLLIFFGFFGLLRAQSDTVMTMRDTFGRDTMRPTEVHTLYLGSDSLQVLVYRVSDNGLTYFNMHDDENICVVEGLQTLRQTGGKLVELRHFGELADRGRHFSFRHAGKIFTFDPNRIFSQNDSIRALTLINKRGYYQAVNVVKRLKSSSTPSIEQCRMAAVEHLRPLADTLLAILDTANTRLIVALHNNHGFPSRCELNSGSRTPRLVNASYNLATYMRAGTLENESCSDIYVNPRHLLTGFFIVLDYDDFMHLVHHRCNAVLQSPNPPDDGSFSVFAAANRLKYINIEAKFDHREEQKRLLEHLESYWKQKNVK
jgi:hypothetical protein